MMRFPVHIVWNDVDRTRTLHEFESLTPLLAWLESVLSGLREDEGYAAWLETFNGSAADDGSTLLAYYDDENLDDHGSLELFADNFGETAFDLYCEAHPPTDTRPEDFHADT